MIAGHVLEMRVYCVHGLPSDLWIEVYVLPLGDVATAYAEVEGRQPPYRCRASNVDQCEHWEWGTPDGGWRDVLVHDVEMDLDLKIACKRAAFAALVACGARTVQP